MKKLLLSFLISGAFIYASAQQPTWDFETWTGIAPNTEPTGWLSENEVVGPFFPGNVQSAFQATTPDIHGGASAVKILSVTMATPVNGLPNPIGMLATGKIVSLQLKFGFPYTARPANASFWDKYTPTSGGDTASCLISLWNGTTHDTIAYGFWSDGTTVSSYTQQNITLTYNPAFASESPDSMAVVFSSTKLFNANYTMCMTCGQAGSTLWVDDISFTGWNGISEHPSSNDMNIYPNPASDYINIIADLNEAYSVVAYDAMGRIISSATLSQAMNGMNRKEGVINTSALSTGLYFYSIKDKNGNALRAGTFNVVR